MKPNQILPISDSLKVVGKPIAYYPEIAKALGNVKSAIFVCQFLYWEGKQADKDGWIYKTQEEIYNETGLSRKEQESARKQLRELGILEEKLIGVPPVKHYKFDWGALDKLICNKGANQFVTFGQINMSETDKSIYTENTTENTTDSSSSNLQLDNDSINSLTSPDIPDYEFLEKVWFYTTGRKILTYYERMTLEGLLKNYGREKLKYALEEAARHNRRELAYIAGILMNSGKKAKKSIWD